MSAQAKPPTGIVSIHGREYETVALRVQRFHAERPGFRILTEIVFRDKDEVVMKASIRNDGGHVVATGHAEEKRASSQINRTSALENCETSAIGRALAALGMGGTEFASANEVANAIHQQAPPKTKSERSPAASAPTRQPPAAKPAARPKPTAFDYDDNGVRTTPIRTDERAMTQDQEDFVVYYSSLGLPKPGAGLSSLLGSVVSWGLMREADYLRAVDRLKAQDSDLAESFAAIAWAHWQGDVEDCLDSIKERQLEKVGKPK